MLKHVLILFCIFCLGGCNRPESINVDNFKIIAHRGGCTYHPENSLSSIKHALSIGVDAIEVDIRLTKDNEIVVCHDDSIGRVTNGSGKISNMSLQQLQTYHLLFQNRTINESIPVLQDVLKLINHQAELYIEIKEYSPRLIKKLADILKSFNYYEDISIVSFSYVSLKEMHDHTTRLSYKYIPYNDSDFAVLPCLSYDFLDGFIFDSYILNNSVLLEAKTLGLPVDVYTIDNIKQLNGVQSDKIRGIITNCPEYWVKLRNR